MASARRPATARRSRRTVAAAVVLLAAAMVALAAPAGRAGAATDPAVVPTYLPSGFISSVHTPAQVDADLGELAAFGIDGAYLNLPRLSATGTLKLSVAVAAMVPLWAARAAAWDTSTGGHLTVTAVLNGRLDKGLDLDVATTRAAVVADAVQVAATGVSGIQLDLEPYPTTTGFLTLLDQLDAALPSGVRLSVVAPPSTATWSPDVLASVSARVAELDPTFYDSGIHQVAAYQQWVAAGLAYDSTWAAPGTAIVPILPSYRSDPWHRPAVENITTATAALATAVDAGDRVDGVGIWWWWGFYFGEGGKYAPAADQATWQSTIRTLLGF